jgi:hypothetical protein
MRLMRSESEAPPHIGVDHILAVLHRLRLGWLLQHFPPRLVRSASVLVNGFTTIGLLALLALLSGNPFVFPSLGPTAYLLFFSPPDQASSPRSTILGHAIAIVCGDGAFAVAGAGAQPFAAHLGIFWPRILAAALSLSTTAALMILLGMSHPPAGATTLIISLGMILQPRELAIIEVAVSLLVAQASVINRLAGLPYSCWTVPASEPETC